MISTCEVEDGVLISLSPSEEGVTSNTVLLCDGEETETFTVESTAFLVRIDIEYQD